MLESLIYNRNVFHEKKKTIFKTIHLLKQSINRRFCHHLKTQLSCCVLNLIYKEKKLTILGALILFKKFSGGPIQSKQTSILKQVLNLCVRIQDNESYPNYSFNEDFLINQSSFKILPCCFRRHLKIHCE